MKNPFTKRQVGKIMIVAAIGAAVMTCVTCFANIYVNSWHLATQSDKPAWVYYFSTWNYMCMDFLRSSGFGYPKSMGMFYLMTSIANGLVAFLYLLVPVFLWQWFRFNKHENKAVA